MGVRTTADEALDRADDLIGDAVKELTKIVVDRCWGHDEFGDSYRREIREAFLALIEVRTKLDRS
jgi:hypothetical protein